MDDNVTVHNTVESSRVDCVVQAAVVHEVVVEPRRSHEPERQLPAGLGDFVGRAAERSLLDAVIPDDVPRTEARSSVVVIEGAPGVGKTSLALWWAHRVQARFPDGTLFADLRGHGPGAPARPAEVLARFLTAAGFPPRRLPADAETLTGLYRTWVSDRRVLIVLDNAADAAQVRPLLPGTGSSMALVTSRTALFGLAITANARRVVLAPFTEAEATDLVLGVVGMARAHAEPACVGELVRLSAGLPIAVRVLAARVASRADLTLAEHVADIEGEGRLEAMSRGSDGRSTLRTVFDWSYRHLDAEHARQFRLLGLHPGVEFSAGAAAALTGRCDRATRRALDSLVDVHLLTPVGRQRYRVHDLLHEFAAERVEPDDDPDCALAGVLRWYAHAATLADRLVFPIHRHIGCTVRSTTAPPHLVDREQALAWLRSEQANLVAALHTADQAGLPDTTMALAAAARFLGLGLRTHWRAQVVAETAGLTAARRGGDPRLELAFLRRRADTHQVAGRWAESEADLVLALEIAREHGGVIARAEVLCGLGRGWKLRGRLLEALACFTEAAALVDKDADPLLRTVVATNLSQVNAGLGRYAEALRHAEHQLSLRELAGDLGGCAYAKHDLAVARQGLGHHRAAVRLGRQAEAVFREMGGSERLLAGVLTTVGRSLVHLGEAGTARGRFAEAADLLGRLGDDPPVRVPAARGGGDSVRGWSAAVFTPSPVRTPGTGDAAPPG
ncbi:ATP-binding protein [Actinokineospora inagensis]|uniref:ATP-binding protein n=1 Tax=Actinokineospora inagensis TaxID=103730 RepID=UPI000688AD50|nr:hypothetical protein [Actinokineospora inagensis]